MYCFTAPWLIWLLIYQTKKLNFYNSNDVPAISISEYKITSRPSNLTI